MDQQTKFKTALAALAASAETKDRKLTKADVKEFLEELDRLREALYELAVGQADVEDAALAGERQVELAKQAQAALLDAKQALPKGQLDLAAIALRQAYGFLGRLFGREADERVIDRIFEKFCLGK